MDRRSLLGFLAVAPKMTPEERIAFAKLGAAARWKK